ncbi:D-Ala-D-Ala carboxypeptidase family metallohydrolase [Roseobacter litoralis]|uniref:D-Ala-D-Ala carboxypeptidase family metallohydrolase n=1 Tax=Roseobacter litoralis TaxID=42443 RepID=UPI0024951864|nr:D-Ala-D-Ala carboxypeptidase family metallohydrolase [Roseobacter litoralis]
MYFNHWSKVPASLWKWSNFSPEEIACRGTGKIGFDPLTMTRLQRLREILGAPIILNSAFRSPEHNQAVGGASGSQHLKGIAFDVSMANHDPVRFEAAAREVGFTGFGFYRRNNFIHIDTGPAREWGERWSVKADEKDTAAPRFSPPPKHRPEKVTHDKAAGATAVGASGALGLVSVVLGAIGDLSPTAQIVAVLGAVLLSLGGLYLIREKVREYIT